MKENPRGPFQRIRWFCHDQTVWPPTANACKEHGGGVQHGQWSDQTVQIRAAGFPIASVLADLQASDFSDESGGQFRFLLLERFLIAADDGWIFRRARFYRGSLQMEGEIKGANRILLGILSRPHWQERDFPLMYEAVRLLPHNNDFASLTEIRGLASSLYKQDPGFKLLRNKIHSQPDAGDARLVRAYAAQREALNPAADYARLADLIDQTWRPEMLPERLEKLAGNINKPELSDLLRADATALKSAVNPAEKLHLTGKLLALLRRHQGDMGNSQQRLAALVTALSLERAAFSSGQELLEGMANTNRARRLAWLSDIVQVLYGTGLLTQRELKQDLLALERLSGAQVNLSVYRTEVNYLSRTPQWAFQRLRYYFSEQLTHLEQIEPLVRGYIPDRLRGSLLLVYSGVLDTLTEDADLLAGVQNSFFGRPVSTGLRSLNAGVARGVLSTPKDLQQAKNQSTPTILIVPKTVANLPPTAGIITANEGNYLSHVQLLARNLGLPNVVVDASLMPELLARRGQFVELKVSNSGMVRLYESADDQARKPTLNAKTIHVDTEKLDLSKRVFLPVSDLRAVDSGVWVGPKAAKLGELMQRFPNTVSPGLAIPFGFFRDMLEQPFTAGGPSLFDWMRQQYAELKALSDAPEKQAVLQRKFLDTLRQRIINTKLDAKFRNGLRMAMQKHFGDDGSYGVFVRSDTNIEDLPDFTGAGLNLTVPNVVGFENVLEAIKRVWASPFSERSFGWRQALMDEPEHVYTSVLLHKSVAVAKSGVMLTADMDTGARDALSLVINEGVGGGVEGQSAESLLINLDSSQVRLLASATATKKRVLLPSGGSELIAASGAGQVLDAGEIRQLITLARQLPERFSMRSGTGDMTGIADVEFGFLEGRLILFQIRPFVDKNAELTDPDLRRMDEALRRTATLAVCMTAKPLTTES